MRIWFNHWFSTAYHLIDLMKRGFPEPLTVIGSGSNPLAVYRKLCDEWYEECDLPPEAYVEFCLRFCKEHGVDVFVPRRGLEAAAGARKRFEALGVRLFAERDGALIRTLDDKAAAYALLERVVPETIPEYRVVRSREEFDAALDGMASPGRRLCYKLTQDEGARSFRVIDERIVRGEAILTKPGSKVTRAMADAVLSEYDFSIPVLVMPYYDGADVSVDCLDTEQGPLMLIRTKVGRYHRTITHPGIQDLCGRIMRALRFEMPVNIQFKMDGEIPRLLEINPRMSGGLQQSCLATGINLPALALRKLTGLPAPWRFPEHFRPVGMVNLETPVIVDVETEES